MEKLSGRVRIVSPGLPAPPTIEALSQVLSLHRGEREALRVALEHNSRLLLSDDTAARLAARNLGIETRGTIGLIVRAIRRRQRSKLEVISILRNLPTTTTLHLKRSLLEDVIREVEDRS